MPQYDWCHVRDITYRHIPLGTRLCESGNTIYEYTCYHHQVGGAERRCVEILGSNPLHFYQLLDLWNRQPKSGFQYASEMIGLGG